MLRLLGLWLEFTKFLESASSQGQFWVMVVVRLGCSSILTTY